MKSSLWLLSLLWIMGAPPKDASGQGSSQPAEDVDAVSATQATTTPADEAESPPDPEKPFDIRNNEQLTGDWFGARTWLQTRGIEFGLSLTSVYQHNVRGGLQTHHGHAISGSADYELTLDFEAMGLWKGGTFYMAAESGWQDDVVGVDRVGSIFGTDGDAIGDQSIYVDELWYEQRFFGTKARFRIGRLDVTRDMDANAYANDETTQFLNPALINTGNVPFPDYGLGMQVVVTPVDWFYAGAVVADAQADGRTTGFKTAFHGAADYFSAFEFGFLPSFDTPWGKLPGGYRFGMWYDPQPKAKFFDDLGGRRRTIPWKRDDLGFYFNMDQLLIKERPDDDADTQGLGCFFRYGYAPGDVNVVEHFWSLGTQYQGLLPTRDNDVLGLGFAQGRISSQLRALEGGEQESVFELYYSIEVFPWLFVAPDFQWIVDPGANHGRDAFVAGARIQASF